MSACFNVFSLKQLTIDYACNNFDTFMLAATRNIISELMYNALIHRKVVLIEIRKREEFECGRSDISTLIDYETDDEEVEIQHSDMFKNCDINDIRGFQKIKRYHSPDIPSFVFLMNEVHAIYFAIDCRRYCRKCMDFYRPSSEISVLFREDVKIYTNYQMVLYLKSYNSYCHLCDNQLFIVRQASSE